MGNREKSHSVRAGEVDKIINNPKAVGANRRAPGFPSTGASAASFENFFCLPCKYVDGEHAPFD